MCKIECIKVKSCLLSKYEQNQIGLCYLKVNYWLQTNAPNHPWYIKQSNRMNMNNEKKLLLSDYRNGITKKE